MVIREDR